MGWRFDFAWQRSSWPRNVSVGVTIFGLASCSLAIGELPDGVEPGASGGKGNTGGSAGVDSGGTGNVAGNSGGGGAAAGGGIAGGTSGGAGGATGGAGGASGGAGGATGGAGGATGGAGGATGGTGGACPKPCDCDNDGVDSDSTGCGGKDCDDTDPDVFGGQTKFFPTPSKNKGFDYNCSKTSDHERTAVGCGLLPCPGSSQVWKALPACGAKGEWGNCTGTLCSFKKLEDLVATCH